MLIGARVAQGLFGALFIPQGMAIMAATFPKPMLQKAFGIFAPILGVFAVGGPILGGVLIDANLFGLEWRPIFLINVILGGFALGLVAILAGIGIMLAFVQTAGLGLEWWQVGIATLLMGVGAGICFSSIFNTALGDVDAHEAGSASGSLSAVQQVANGVGSALVTSIFLTLLPSGDIEAASATRRFARPCRSLPSRCATASSYRSRRH